jgi:sec-independent protein translocase protein TatC
MAARMKKSRKKSPSKNRLHSKVDVQLPFIEHIYELRKRLFYVALSVISVALVCYAVQQRLVAILLEPAKGQKFIYTSPGGGLDFLFRVCMYTGIAVSIPVIIFQLLKYMQPLLRDNTTSRYIALGSIVSGVLALVGIMFGYFICLPAVLHFLLHQFTSQQIQPLVTIQSYIAFVTVYMLGSALLLQVPLVLIFINRIKPLKPSKLLHIERWVILGAFVASGLMNPTPNIISQLMVAGPIIIMYQLGILIIWQVNRRSRHSPKVVALLAQDAEAQMARLAVARKLEPAITDSTPLQPIAIAPVATSSPTAPSRPMPATESVRRRIFSDVRPTYDRFARAE